MESTRISTGTMSKDIDSVYYSGPSIAIDLPDPEIYGTIKESSLLKSFPEGAPYGNANEQRFPLSYGFNNPSSAQTWDALMKYTITPYGVVDQEGNLGYVMSTASNTWINPIEDLEAGGVTFNPVEDVYNPNDKLQDRFGGWKAVTEQANVIEYVKQNKELGLWQSPEVMSEYAKHSPDMTDVKLFVTNHDGLIPINKFGEYLSRIANLEVDLRDVIYMDHFFEGVGLNKETEAYLDFLIEKELGPGREIRAIGVENLEGAIARTYHNGTATLVASKDIYDKALSMANKHGLDGEEAVKFAKRTIWYHELYHVFNRENLPERQDEIRVGEFLAEFLGERAPQLEGKIARHYEALAKENKDYAQRWREGRIAPDAKSFRAKIANLMLKYESEAKDMNLDEKGAKDYVANKLEEYVDELKESGDSEAEDYSANDSKYDKNTETDSEAEDSGNNEADNADADGAEDTADGASGEAE
jgi:hypothetical protein